MPWIVPKTSQEILLANLALDYCEYFKKEHADLFSSCQVAMTEFYKREDHIGLVARMVLIKRYHTLTK